MARQPTLVGQPVLLVIDIQQSAFQEQKSGIPTMPGYRAAMEQGCRVIETARGAGIPVIFFQEHHRKSMVDYGRELDGSEGIHCLEGEPGTPVALETGYREGEDLFIRKRRYSCFFGTELEILLKGLKAETLILIGGMTDVCVHYTFVDGHQHDYYCRVVSDAVGGTSPEAHQASLNAMEYLQAGAVLTAEGLSEALSAAKAA